MGTNFYLRFKDKQAKNLWFKPGDYEIVDEPDFAYEVHIAKTSCGWKPLFQASWHIHSVDGIKAVCESIPDCKIVDEYNTVYTWDEFREWVLDFNRDKEGVATKDEVDDTHRLSHILYNYPYQSSRGSYFYDNDGYEFDCEQFS